MTKSKSSQWREALKVWSLRLCPSLFLTVGCLVLLNPMLVKYLSERFDNKVPDEVRQELKNQVKQQIQDEAKKQVEAERAKPPSGQEALEKLAQTEPLGRLYISGEISKQAEEQSKKAAKDEISQVKGDLLGQMAFPVIFAIASIFAAFAVKDILTEILKKQERNALEKEIVETLEGKLGMSDQYNKLYPGLANKTPLVKLKNKVEDEIKNLHKTTNGLNQTIDDKTKELREEYDVRIGLIEYDIASLSLHDATENLVSHGKKSVMQEKILIKHICKVDAALRDLESKVNYGSEQIELLRIYNHAIYNHAYYTIRGGLKSADDTSKIEPIEIERIGVTLTKAQLMLSELNGKEHSDEVKKIIGDLDSIIRPF